jgi:DNA-binding transcriptional LysR family regulator
VEIRVGCAPDVALQRLQSFLGALHARDPQLRSWVAHLRSADQLARLRCGELELGLIHGGDVGSGIATEPVFTGERIVAVLPIGHRLAARGAIDHSDFARDTLLLTPRDADPALHDRLASVHGDRFHAVRETLGTDVRDLLLAVGDGFGVGLCPASMLVSIGELNRVVTTTTVEPPSYLPDTLLAWSTDPRVGASDRVIDAACAAVGDLRRS